MDFVDWLLYSIKVSRNLTNGYYIIMLIITLIAVILLMKMRFKRFSMYLWLISGLICLFWELYLFFTGTRSYNFYPALELPYHALTEAGPGLIIMILFAHKIKLIDISDYSDDYCEKKPEKMKTPGREKGVPRKKIKQKSTREEYKDDVEKGVDIEEDNDLEETEE